MDRTESHAQSLGICYRIYQLIMKAFTSQALKTVTLGRSTQFGSTKVQVRREEEIVIKPETNEQSGEEKLVPPGKAPKKTVSINDNVEEIDDRKNWKKRSKSFQKSNSLEKQQEEKENIKPLRPILKVKSNLDERSISNVR